MISKTRMLALIKDHQSRAVESGLSENPALLSFRDGKGRNWLHLCCGVNPRARGHSPAAAVKTSAYALARSSRISSVGASPDESGRGEASSPRMVM